MREEAARDKMLAGTRTQRGDPSSSSSSRRPHRLVPIHAHIQPAAADESVPRSVAMGDGLLDAVQSAARQQEQYSITHQHAHAHQHQYQYQHHPRRHHQQQQQQQPRAQFHPLPPRPVAGLDPSWSRSPLRSGRGRDHRPGRTRPPAAMGPRIGFGRIPIKPMAQDHINGEWVLWDSLALTIHGLPKDITTFTLWASFAQHGDVDYIEIFENGRGQREGKGKICYRPPPKHAFWLEPYHLNLESGQSVPLKLTVNPHRPDSGVPSPVRPEMIYPPKVELHASSVKFGSLTGENSFLSLHSVVGKDSGPIRLVVDVAHREVEVFLYVTKLDLSRNKPKGSSHQFRFRIPFLQISNIRQVKQDGKVSWVIPLDSPAICHRKLDNLASAGRSAKTMFPESENAWNSNDTWFRQTDIAQFPDSLKLVAVNLHRKNSYINFGRWTTFQLTLAETNVVTQTLATLRNIFRDFNVELREVDDFAATENLPPKPTVWDFLEDKNNTLPFPVRYQLEVCISHRYLNEYTLGEEFVCRLASLGEEKAKALLEHVATNKTVYPDPMKIFDIPSPQGATNARIPKHCCYMRSAQVTPSTIYYNTPSVDMSNRVIRHYPVYADRFLRVRFTDEKYLGKIYATNNLCTSEVFTRVGRTLRNGITIGDRHYEFLAFGNSQFRENGAYFFASLPHLTASNIRAWMGNFSDIRSVAKHAARLGQCFSTTRAVRGCTVQVHEIDDIERNGYTFSDGVGRISKFLAQMIVNEFNIPVPPEQPPSVFQFRLGGRKGILMVSPEARHREVHIRKSQHKFEAEHNGLEIIKYSQFCWATLNRQLIPVLSALGVPDEVFIEKLRTMLVKLDLAMTNGEQAIHLLQTYVDPNQMTLALADMVVDGFQDSQEPFVASLLELWRAWQIQYLKEKAKIAIDKGAYLLGCIDETGLLKGYYHDSQPGKDATREQRVACLPEIFVQISRPGKSKPEVIEGVCIVARNPSLHPGDIRVVKAVDVPALHQLKDVVVFPQTGDRDVPSMCSGGDLDGDDYIVIWDQDLIPEMWFRKPMDHTAAKPKVLDRDVTIDDIITFYVNYMKNDRLPQIATAHLALADDLERGIEDDKCIKLAGLHSAAVDYNKSGVEVHMTRDLKPRKWPHFMEKKRSKTYTSRKILGQLYDIVERVDFRPKQTLQFDKRILNSEYETSDKWVDIATELKAQYDADMRRLMAQHEIKSEFEIWSTFALSHSKLTKDFKFHEELGQISSSLREKFRNACYDKVGGKDFDLVAPLAVAMYKVTSNQMQTAMAESFNSPVQEQEKRLPLISFPWVLHPVLGEIARRYPGISSEGHNAVPLPEVIPPSQKIENVASTVPPPIETADGLKPAGTVMNLFGDSEMDLLADLGNDLIFPTIPARLTETNGLVNPNEDSLLDLVDDLPVFTNPTQIDRLVDVGSDSWGSSTTQISDTGEDSGGVSSNGPPSPAFAAPVYQVDDLKLGGPSNDSFKSSLATNQANFPDQAGDEEEDQCEEIVEMEEEVRPTAVDELELLVGEDLGF
ncbi:hypothetical protein FQN51_004861 [Onygenales sp. PD_10]|nr:hypothetical protein FQN51_004861 [Onygenales sp. PD_10]